MGLSTRVAIQIRGTLTATSPYGSGGTAEVSVSEILSSGTGAYAADKMAQWTTSTGTNTDVDVRSQVDSNGVACDFAEIVAMVFQASSSNAGNIEIKPAAANGWVALLPDASDKIVLPPGATAVFFCPAASAWAMGASTDTINVASTSGTGSVTITVIGRSA